MTEAEDFEFEEPKQNICRLIKLKEMKTIRRLLKPIIFREELRYQCRCRLKKPLQKNSYEVKIFSFVD